MKTKVVISPRALQQSLRRRTSRRTVLDVREPSEFAAAHIALSKNIPLSRLEPSSLPEGTLYLVCERGTRAKAAAEQILGDAGSKSEDVLVLDGGLRAWREAGFPLVQGASSGKSRRTTGAMPTTEGRYARQLVLEEVGATGQAKLRKAKVLVVGLGGLGSPVALYLAAAGVGTLGLLDDDRVSLSNLHRQILHGEKSLGEAKSKSAGKGIRALNRHTKVHAIQKRLDEKNARSILERYDLVVDASDNLSTRYLVNRVAHEKQKALVSGAVHRFEGNVVSFDWRTTNKRKGPCYACLFPPYRDARLEPNCQDAGVIGAVCGVIGSFQAIEALKILLGIGEVGKLLLVDSRNLVCRTVRFERDRQCTVCS